MAVQTYFLYEGSMPVCELNSSGTVVATNTFGKAGLAARHTSAGSYTYLFDPQGNVADRLGPTGVFNFMFDAFGSRSGADPVSDPYSGFGGEWGYYTGAETGLQLLSHRYYDSRTGRFINRDPIGYKGGTNLYCYVGNNPCNAIGPSGTDPITPLSLDEVFPSAYGDSSLPEAGASCFVHAENAAQLLSNSPYAGGHFVEIEPAALERLPRARANLMKSAAA